MARKILLADDSVTAQNMGRKILADAGYEVITVNNGSAALKKITETKPDLIVLDVYMPGYSGLEVCQRLKEVQETSRIPVLLTVGKLEPFKPEEAKRVRAEGYIVKPFEASELLSALAKLEDKIVPRAEASKPGRFARANAALDEGRYDKTVAIEEDLGWKDRISFPTKKKSKAAEAEEDANEAAVPAPTPAVQTPINKELANVVEPYHASETKSDTQPDSRVNLGALAPEGLPKDVTPEEIAALAAAAAQVKGKIAESTGAEPTSQGPATEVAQPEAKTEAQPAAEIPAEVHAKEAVTFASQKAEEKIETPAAASSEPAPEVSVPSPAKVDAAIAALEPVTTDSAHASSGNGSAPHAAAEKSAEEPVTMAAAAGAGSTQASSRWMAVPVALATEEAAISLEQEMQKAYAAFAEAQNAHAQFVASIPEIPAATEQSPEPVAEQSVPAPATPPVETAVADPVASAPESPGPEVSQAMSAVASAATEAVSAAVKELEAVAASYTDLHPQAPAQPAPTPQASEAPQPVEGKIAEEEPASPEPAPSKSDAPEMLAEQPRIEEAKVEEPRHDEQKIEEPRNEEAKLETWTREESEQKTRNEEMKAEEPQPVASVEVPATPAPEPAPQPAAASSSDNGRKDSDIAATTAAAWANWRRVRESGSPKDSDEAPQDAARAVAAGAEKTPDGVSPANQDSGDIADIVDSVLADLRPKIVEEISRKMKKK